MKNKAIDILESELENEELTSELESKLLQNPEIILGLKELVSGRSKISTLELRSYTQNGKVIDLIEDYLIKNNIEITDFLCYVSRKGSSLDPVNKYFKDISKIPLLTREEEVCLFKKYVNSTDEDERSEIKKMIVSCNLRLVVFIAKKQKYQNRGLELLEIIQEGNIGLINTVDKFDYTKGCKFATYATWWIKQAIERALSDKGRTIRIPVHAYERLKKIRHIINSYYALNQEELVLDSETISDIARSMHITPEYVELLLKQDHILSLDQPVTASSDSEDELKDFIPYECEPYEVALNGITKQEARDLLESCGFSERDLYVMKMKFGFVSPEPMTLKEISEVVGVTYERVRQIENKCLETLKIRAKKRNILY